MSQDRFEIGATPGEAGEVPARMLAQVVRQSRFGDPLTAFEVEEVDTPSPGPGEVLIAVMAAGINYNNVWAAMGIPVDIIAMRQKRGEAWDFHIGGSDASGVVWAVGEGVTSVAVGDEVVVHHGVWDLDDRWVVAGNDPMLAPSARIWGYDGPNFGSFAQFTLAHEHQVLPKAGHLNWEEAAASTLVGATAYRMLHGWAGNTVKADDVVLVWGGSGGLGIQSIQLARHAGAIPIAVVSDDERGAYTVQHGAAGYIIRTQFEHWGTPPHWTDPDHGAWQRQAQGFGKAIWDILGERRNPNIVIEHPGESTIPTSIFVCDRGGMVVVCAGTTGYSATVDLRYLWVSQKRLQGSHGANDEQSRAYNQLLIDGHITPALGDTLTFEQIPQAHHDMQQGLNVHGNRVALVGASGPQQGVR